MTFVQENAYLILLHGCSLVEDFNNFRLCGSNFPAANYMAVADPAEGPGARFSKVPIINGPGKLSPFTLKIEFSIVLHLTWQNCQLMKQNGVVC